ncbi:lamin-B2-like isoform X2 [Phyllopteryx taeniolatus]|uniref:lamin-B2-like isoform X2 n=1 Tax=Phyllopteryx taeniolatus TaxID=161469 RepID=UPI002AD2F31D|nr:lamin-B2-like isoform X2 [Phyllopteryx taeniolatus]
MIKDKGKNTTPLVSSVKRAYEAELADARRLADEGARERARLKVELEEATRSGKKKDADLAAAVSRASALESQLKRSDVTLAMALSVDAALKALLDKAEDAHAVARRQLKVETSMRVGLENRCQELELRKNKFEEGRESRRRQEQRIVEVDSGARQDYEFKLSQALQDLRKQHDDQVTLYKEELEQTFQAKLDNAKVSSAMNDKAVRTAREELQESRMRIEGLAYQLSALQKQAAAAEDRVRELEDILSSDRDKHRRAMEAKDREMNDLRQRMNAQLSEYQELLDVKLTLDMEINAYRKLLDGKQRRATSRITVSRVTGSSLSRTSKTNLPNVESGKPTEKFLLRSGKHAVSIAPVHADRNFITLVWSADVGVAHSPPSDLWKSQASWATGLDINHQLGQR